MINSHVKINSMNLKGNIEFLPIILNIINRTNLLELLRASKLLYHDKNHILCTHGEAISAPYNSDNSK